MDAQADFGFPDPGETMRKTAMFSPSRLYRYALERTWDNNKGTVLWVMLNPSTADENEDDPTIKKCIGFAKRWGYGRILVANLFAYRSTNPKVLTLLENPIGASNDRILMELIERVDLVVAAWGAHPSVTKRAKAVLGILGERGDRLVCLGETKDGWPRHPLYVPYDTPTRAYERFRL